MKARFHLHVRVLPGGRAIFTPVHFQHLGVDGDDVDRTRTAVLADEAAIVVRVYDEGRRLVRAPRTGTVVKDTETVLREGRIDPFLLAAVRLRRDRTRQPA